MWGVENSQKHPLFNIVKDVYKDSVVLSGRNSIPIHRGVKQGDPLSPLLWNFFYQVFLKAIKSISIGAKYGLELDPNYINLCALADDLVVFENDWQKFAQVCQTIFRLADNLEIKFGMSPSGDILGKTAAYVSRHSPHKMATDIKYEYYVIPVLSIDQCYRYLGSFRGALPKKEKETSLTMIKKWEERLNLAAS